MMRRMHGVPLFDNLSGPAMQDTLYDSAAAQVERRTAAIRAKVEHPFLYV